MNVRVILYCFRVGVAQLSVKVLFPKELIQLFGHVSLVSERAILPLEHVCRKLGHWFFHLGTVNPMVTTGNSFRSPKTDMLRFDFDESGPISGPEHSAKALFSFNFIEIVGGKWCPEEDSNLHVHTDTST